MSISSLPTYSLASSRSIRAGFTLMEVMVAVSIFTIIVTVGIGALLITHDSSRRSQSQRQGIDSLTYVLESMSRRMRTAQSWDMETGVSTSFTFKDQYGIIVEYNWTADDAITMKITNPIPCSTCPQPSIPDGTYDLTPQNVAIKNLVFTVFKSDDQQPYTQINIAGTITKSDQVSDFSFQTSVSKRSFEMDVIKNNRLPTSPGTGLGG